MSTPATITKRIFIECTETYFSTFNTGVQRVVRGLVNSAKSAGSSIGIECVPVVFHDNQFFAVDQIPPIEEVKSNIYNPVIGGMRNAISGMIVRMGGVQMMQTVKQTVRSAKRIISPRTHPTTGVPVQPRSGDVLLLADISWSVPMHRALENSKTAGVRIGFILYDLIPIRIPHLVHPNVASEFAQWMNRMLTTAEFCLAISEATLNDFRHFLEERDPAKVLSMRRGAFRLGADFDRAISPSSAGPREKIKEIFSSAPPYITVSTIEPRKNHRYLLAAFEEIWRRNINVSLCIIGVVHPMCTSFVKGVRKHPEFGKRLFMFNDVADAELGYCYERAKALVFPSLMEGFGLPIIEALSKGKPVMASDIAIHREVGGSHCMYFDLSSPAALAGLIEQYETQGDRLLQPSPDVKFSWITWEDSCADLIQKVLELQR